MANKEALLELQQRLSQRLQTAQAQNDSQSWLAVRVGPEHFLLPLSQSGEIFPLAAMTRVPYTQPWFSGVANLRGGLFGVVDLQRFLDPNAGARDEQALALARLVTLSVELGVNCALVVDDLQGLRRENMFKSSEEAAALAPAYFGRRFLDERGVVWQELNLRLLSQTSAFQEIGAGTST